MTSQQPLLALALVREGFEDQFPDERSMIFEWKLIKFND
jgi:hypothetical protein